MKKMGVELWLINWVELRGRIMYRGQQKLNWQVKLLLVARHLKGLECQAEEAGHLY